MFSVRLPRELSKDEQIILVIETIFLNKYMNFPLSIELSEDQKFEYADSKTFVAPYPVRQQVVNYKFAKIMYVFFKLVVSDLMVRKKDLVQ